MTPLAVLLLIALAIGPHTAFAQKYAAREEVRRFISDMVEQHGFVRSELLTLFSKVRHQPAILRAVSTPAEAAPRSWQAYRARFINTERIDAGVRFYGRHATVLQRAAKIYGVPEEIIVAIIGVETVYGRNVGGYRVIDALTTLAFDYPPRAEYFRGELEQFLLHARQESINLLALKGSYAGAIGIPQFMPRSYRRYAVDFDGDGRRDISGSAVDALGSVANFLKEHGWQRGQPVAFVARIVGERFRTLIASGIKPVYRAGDLADFGVSVKEDLGPETGIALIDLETAGQATEYWVGMENFYVLTRYNRSSFYAIAVLELAREIANTLAKQNGGTEVR